MQKTKLGISVGLLGAIFLFVCLFGGYTVAVLIAGYILIAEDNAWLRRTAVKGIVLMLIFTIVSALLNLIPGAFSIVNETLTIFNTSFYPRVISRIFTLFNSLLTYGERILFLILGFKALKQETLVIPPLDSFIGKFMN